MRVETKCKENERLYFFLLLGEHNNITTFLYNISYTFCTYSSHPFVYKMPSSIIYI